MTADHTGRFAPGNRRMPSLVAALLYALPLLLLVETIALPIAVTASNRPNEIAHLKDALDVIAVGLFVATGMLLLIRTRLVNERRTAAAGIAFLVMAAGYPLSWAIAPVHADSASQELEPLMRTVCFAVAIAVLYLAAGHDRPTPRPWVISVTSSALIGASLVTLVVVHEITQRPLDVSHGVYATTQVLLGAGWLLVARSCYTSRRLTGDGWVMTVLPFGLLGLADLLRTHAVTHQLAWLMTAAALRVTAGALAVVAAAAVLQRALAAEAARLSSTEHALAATERLLTDDEMMQSRQRHDARSVVSAIHLALATLEKYGERLTEETRDRLRSESLRELDRLRDVIEPPPMSTASPVALIDVLTPFADVGGSAGTEVELDVQECVVSAHAADLQVVLLTLLAGMGPTRNGRVRLTSRAVGDHVELAVVSPDSHRSGPHRPDQPDAEDRGIGYSACQRLMHTMGGEICRDRHGGFVITLPTARSAQPVEHALEVADDPDVQSVVTSQGFGPARVGSRRVDDSDRTRAQPIRNAPVIDDGEVDDQGAGIPALADVDAACAEDPGKRVRQQRGSSRHDSGETGRSGHEPIDARGRGLSIPQKVELS